MSNRRTIMLVEDNPITRKMLRVALETEGYAIVEAADGRSALDLAENRSPDLVLQDLVLPDITGFELVGRLRGLPGAAGIPIIALSGFAGQMEEARLARAGFTACLEKPIEPSRLVETIATYLPRSTRRGDVGGDKQVLLVDDDPVQLKLALIRLVDMGFKVLTASSATEALRVAHKHPPDVILSDVLMPEVDGFQLCLSVRTSPRLAHVPVVLLSGQYETSDNQDLARRMGANELILRTPGLDGVDKRLLDAIASGPPAGVPEPNEAMQVAHAKAVVHQLERQLAIAAGLARRCTLQAAQLALLGGITGALAKNSDFDVALRDVLAATLDAAAISKGALFLRDEPGGRLRLRHAIGFSDDERAALADFFGAAPTLEKIVAERIAVSLPSPAVPDSVGSFVIAAANAAFAEVVPLVAHDVGIGAILLAARRTDVTSEDSVAFARAIGNQIVQSLELEAAFRKLVDSEQRYRTLMESANDGISILSADGIVREVNHRFEEALGMPRSEIIGQRGPGVGQSTQDQSAPVEITRGDGSSVLMEFSNTEVHVGREHLVFSIGRDVTEQVRANAHLMASDRMASVGMLAAGIAHEINNPLSVVITNLEYAKSGLQQGDARSSDDRADFLASIDDALEAADRVRGIVHDVKLFSRAEEDHNTRVDVHRVLDSSLRMAHPEVRHRARVVKAFGVVSPVLANESRLGQVFLNLIVNAAQALPEGHADTNEIRIATRTRDSDGAVVVDVSDTGTGIPPETLKKLFKPFFTTKPRGVGTGLGLIICKRIVTSLGGDIAVESEVGKGTLVRVVLPATEIPAEASVPSPPVISARRRGRVLVVDDEEMVGTMIRRVLAREHDVEYIQSAREALARVAAGERFDVILCDVMMPITTGLEFRDELLRIVPEQAERLVFMTGAACTPKVRVALDATPNLRMDKPFDVAGLRAVVNQRVE